jgi:uncharacterized protein (DUF488 family)
MNPTIYTIGHSNHSFEEFLDLLKRHEIEVLVDVRSQPYSSYSDQFNEKPLSASLEKEGIQYLFMGKELGGRPTGGSFYDHEGRVRYDRVAESPSFLEGVERMKEDCRKTRIALMCGEENPNVCHRHLLVGRVLSGMGIEMLHIRGDGGLQTDEELAASEGKAPEEAKQEALFDFEKEPEWKSLRSVLPKKPRTNSFPD